VGTRAPLELTQEGLLPHQAQHPFVVDGPPRPLQRLGHPPIPVAGKCQHQVLDRRPERPLLRVGLGGLAGVVPAAADVEEGAQMAHGHLCAQLRDEGVPDAERDRACCKAFFKTMFSTVSWPTTRSNSAIRLSSLGLLGRCASVHAPIPCCAYCSRLCWPLGPSSLS